MLSQREARDAEQEKLWVAVTHLVGKQEKECEQAVTAFAKRIKHELR